MALFGFKSAKEVEAEKQKAASEAAERTIKQNFANLSNLSKGSQINFAITYFDVFDPRLSDVGVPVSVHGTVNYAIEDMDLFRSINKDEGFSDATFHTKLKATVTKYVKSIVTNVPIELQIPVVQIERKIVEISDYAQSRVIPQVEHVLGIKVRSLDVTDIIIDKESRGYRELKALTADLERENIMAKHNAGLSNFNLQNELQQDQLKMQSSLNLDAMRRQQELQLGGQEELQSMQLENQREMMRIQREEMQRASRLQTEQTFLGAHQANLNAGIMNNAINNDYNMFGSQQNNIMGNGFGNMPMNGLGGGMPQMGGGMPQMSGGMPQMGGGMPQMQKAVPQVQYMVGVNGQQAGPFDWNQLQQLVQQGQLTTQTYVWKQGMANWEFAGNVAELAALFGNTMPPMM